MTNRRYFLKSLMAGGLICVPGGKLLYDEVAKAIANNVTPEELTTQFKEEIKASDNIFNAYYFSCGHGKIGQLTPSARAGLVRAMAEQLGKRPDQINLVEEYSP